MNSVQAYNDYIITFPLESIMAAIGFAFVFGHLAAGITWIFKKNCRKKKERHEYSIGIGATIFVFFVFIGIGFAFDGSNEEAHIGVLEENLSQKYEFEEMIWERTCEGSSNCTKPSQPDEQKIFLQVEGEPKVYALTQDPDTNEPFLRDPFTGEEVVNILK